MWRSPGSSGPRDLEVQAAEMVSGFENEEPVEGILAERDRDLLEDDSSRAIKNQGSRMIETLGPAAGSLNVIPSGHPGRCHPVLLVALGAQEDAEPRILQAVEHIHVRCKDTRRVVFWAAWWDSSVWVRHRDSFKGVRVTLRMLGMPPIVL
jgi:hypothetical protein